MTQSPITDNGHVGTLCEFCGMPMDGEDGKKIHVLGATQAPSGRTVSIAIMGWSDTDGHDEGGHPVDVHATCLQDMMSSLISWLYAQAAK